MATKAKAAIADTRRVNDILKRLHTAKSAANSNLMDVGKCLVELRAEYDSANEFLEKAIEETGYARTTIYSYMTIYKDWKGKPDLVDRFDFKALEALAKDSTPDAAVARAAKAASRGKLISAQMAKEIIAECSKNGQDDDVSDYEQETSDVRLADETPTPEPAAATVRERPQRPSGKKGTAFDPDTSVKPSGPAWPAEVTQTDGYEELTSKEADDEPEPEPPKARRAVLPELPDLLGNPLETLNVVLRMHKFSRQTYLDLLDGIDAYRESVVEKLGEVEAEQ